MRSPRSRFKPAEVIYRLFGTAIPDTDQVVEAVQKNGYDGVIVSSRLEPGTVESYTPGYVTTEPVTRYSRWTNSYRTYYVSVEHPGYTETQRVVRHRVDVWETGEPGRLLWTAEGQSIDPGSSSQVNKEITNVVIPELAKSGIIPK